jgi:predicted outer membrane repeat protein
LFSGDGLSITNTVVFSNAALSGGGAYAAGAAWINGGNFAENSSTEYGGGFYAMAPITLTNTAFVSNSANINGGGLYASGMLSIDKGRFENNHGFRGGGLHAIDSMTITQTYFISNSAGLTGGGFATHGAWTVIGSTFEANQAQRGGGIYVYDGVGLAVNTLFARNEALLGSALFLAGQSTAILHSTVAGIPGTGSGISTYASTASLALVNSILAHHDVAIENTAGPVIQDYNLFFENTTDILGSYSGGANNQSGDPHFLDPDAGDYRLSRGSAAIDAGFDSGIPVDFEDEARPLGSGVDIGFDEANLIEGLMISYTPNPTINVQTPVTFTASIASGAPASFIWDFGDGSAQQAGNPLTHSYLLPGVYTVTVTAANLIDSGFANAVLEVQLAEGNKLYLPVVVR